VVGINSAIATAPNSTSSSEGGNIGVGFAIPIDEAAPTAQDIIATGRAAHPFLGVSTVDSGSPVGAKVTTTQDPCGGGTIPGVQPGSPASKGGLRDGDVITAIGGHAIQGSDDLVTQIRLLRVGNRIAVSYRRAGVARAVTVSLVERPRS
jgi:putative serine protease PepD